MTITIPEAFEIEQVISATARHRFGALVNQTNVLATAIRELSDFYLADPERRGACPDSPAHRAARLLFFTLADLPKAFAVAAELDQLVGLLQQQHLKILDLGVGYGAQSLGVLSYLAQAAPACTVHLDVVDRDAEVLAAVGQLLANCQAERLIGKVEVASYRRDLTQAFTPPAKYDLIVMGNTLCELPFAGQTRLIAQLLAAVTERGVLCLIEPALRATARQLHHLRDELLARQAGTIVAPCTSQTPCPCLLNPQDWCHEARPYLLPPQARQLSTITGLRTADVKWSYLTISPRSPGAGNAADVWRVVSELHKPKGKYEVFVCGASGRLRAVLQKRDKTPANELFKKLQRGQRVHLQQVRIAAPYVFLEKDSRVRHLDFAGE